MKKAPLAAVILYIALFSATEALAEQQNSKDLYLNISPRLWGLDLGVGVSTWDIAPPLDTIIWVMAGGAWDNKGYFRNPDNSPYTGSLSGFDAATAPYYNRLDLRWRLGIEQGLIDNPALPKDLLTTFFFVQAEFSRPLEDGSVKQLLFYPDNGSPYVHSAEAGDDVHLSGLLGFKLDTTERAKVTKVYSGYYAESSIELAPGPVVDPLTSNVNYGRLNLTAKYFLPLYQARPSERGNVFALYAADRIIVDYLWGSAIP
ncbi:hypothetical protein, partial [Salinispira pacifica]